MTALPTWTDQMRALEGVAENLIATWRPDGATEAETQDMNKLALSILADGYLCHVYTDARRPVFMPLWNFACNQGGPNPDYVYLTTEVDPAGVYEISGFRGTTRFVEITQQESEMTSPKHFERRTGPPLRVTNDLDELTTGADGSFRVTLSARRPDGHSGDWWPLDPRTRKLLMRKCACDWTQEVDARVAINRLDDHGADMTPTESAGRFSDMADWIDGMIRFDMQLVRYYREHHGINVLLRSQWIEDAGGLAKQAYYDGIHQIADDEALIVEFPVPTECHYWQILVADDRFSTVDWVNRQSSLNDFQARVDPDGWFRAVVSRQDPGVHNWLDKADFPWGILQARFYRANEYPKATVTKVPVADVLMHLPSDTVVVTPAERAQQLRTRREGAQLRRIW
ncbi:DUF1214 domain-containing protein [Frankia sp. AgB1.9]|uniref:DUF1214 domain-containing protein n=1 Tax=unclassified Frankia TaxID=2632575 RepID=UPI001933FD0D|nr:MULTISPECIES: DUF1214 domain-containing protein [unclassified Frankia]MBL7492632.1 DUF1214 domain-containing protein [Frankia sp. AgW1.1]MBL7549335.1 DUF1214 domain-containing protein [Frankia sp. AgB1.9]MBL7619198.1 DUF1214 domain-containing protein [Frankia sp. AgB1.8]